MMNILKWILDRIAERNPMYLSHHPLCRYYNHHTFTLYGHQLCMGCFVVYPVASVSTLLISIVWYAVPEIGIFSVETYIFYMVGLVLISPAISNKLLLNLEKKRIRMIIKTFLAIGLAIIFTPFIFRPHDRLLTISLLSIFLLPYIVYKGVTSLDDCDGCPEKDEFPNCSGMEFNQQSTSEESLD